VIVKVIVMECTLLAHLSNVLVKSVIKLRPNEARRLSGEKVSDATREGLAHSQMLL
jgi:hypothetical protein